MSESTLHLLPLGPAEEQLLVEQLRRGEPDAFEVLYQRYLGRVLGVATQILGDRASAQDVAQETFIKVYAQLRRFKGRGRLASWIHRITVNQALSELRRRKRASRKHQARAAEVRCDETAIGGPELSATLASVLAKLEPTKRLTFYLAHVEELSAAEIAEVLDEGRQAVLKRLQRTRRELMQLWEEAEAEAADADKVGGVG